ncbi:hypothetical protein G9C98_000375 [Cotesia typhae]|uniref:Sulfotransferase domain-containing protein n=1 Tax=Cotesia typhae TaxID=2053667 RepID=A0A8J5V048_9HYME|nr:hypothetical protein G9C98_000375 [Cotesia typhae]
MFIRNTLISQHSDKLLRSTFFNTLLLLIFLHLSNADIRLKRNFNKYPVLLEVPSEGRNKSSVIEDVLNRQQRDIQLSMENYRYPKNNHGSNISDIDDLLMNKGGRPLRSVILGYWRGGSTFLGEILNSHPANFYHFEPLLDFGILRIRTPPLTEQAIANLIALFNCDYDKLQHYIEYGKTTPWGFKYNPRLWKNCETYKDICWDSNYLTEFCRLFPFQSMKILRLTLQIAQILLDDEKLGVHMALLVRDPRGLVQSRKHPKWCQDSHDCSDPALLCADMVSDYEVAVQLKDKYPQNFKVIRYEDLSTDPISESKELFKFYGLNFHSDVQNYLETHTLSDSGGKFSTFRNSKATPFHWRDDLDFEEVQEIQRVCSIAMRLWGYAMAANQTHQKEFDPVIRNYPL